MIHIVWGKKLFGAVDRVPGLFNVATEFFHLWYMPLIPLRSVIVISQTSNSWNGIEIPMSLKSIALAWIRTCLLLGWALIGTIWLLVVVTDNHVRSSDVNLALAWTAATFMMWLALLILPMKLQAGKERAFELANLAKLTPNGWDTLKSIYGN